MRKRSVKADGSVFGDFGGLKKGRNEMMKGCNNICGSVGDDPRKEERKWQTI